jgi:hypothetical protein
MNNSLEEKIKNSLKDAKPWQRVPTSVDGVFLVKTPSSGGKETMMVEINPTDEMGNPLKRRGVFLRKKSDLQGFLEVMENEKLKELLEALESISGVSGEKPIKPVEI